MLNVNIQSCGGELHIAHCISSQEQLPVKCVTCKVKTCALIKETKKKIASKRKYRGKKEDGIESEICREVGIQKYVI
jgi:hypothetical protein